MKLGTLPQLLSRWIRSPDERGAVSAESQPRDPRLQELVVQLLLQRWEPIEAQRRSKLMLSILAGASGLLGVAALALRRRRNQSTPETATANALT